MNNCKHGGSDCERCIWADVSYEPRVITREDVTIYQLSNKNINCKCDHIKEMFFTDDGMVCSSYEEKQ